MPNMAPPPKPIGSDGGENQSDATSDLTDSPNLRKGFDHGDSLMEVDPWAGVKTHSVRVSQRGNIATS